MGQREVLGALMQDLWDKNEPHRLELSAAMRQLWKDAEYRERMGDLLSRGLADRWSSAKWRKALMESLRAHHNSPAEKAKRSAIATRGYHNGHRERLLAARNTPERKQRHGLVIRYAAQGGRNASSLKQRCIDHLKANGETTVDEWAAILEAQYKLMGRPKSTPRQRARDMVKVVQRSTDLSIGYDPVSERIWLEKPKKRTAKSKG